MTAPRATVLAMALAAVAVGTATASAQSLADVARKAEERRAETKAPVRTYANGNLTPDFTAPAPPAASASAPETAGERRRDPAVAAPGREGGPDAPPDEAYWRRQAKAMNARLEEARKAMANVPNPATDTPGELQRVEEYVAKAKARLARAEEDYQIFLMQADVAKVPKAWIQ